MTVTAAVSDPGAADVLSCGFDWDGGGPAAAVPAAAGTCSGSNTFTQAGIYTVRVTVSDGDGGVDSETVAIVVVDPGAGFVTGGGTIDSPAGAVMAEPSLAGRASFGVVAKYHKHGSVPAGNVELGLHPKGFRFRSTAFEWLVVAGDRAQLRGTGTVDGGGSYGFLLTVRDDGSGLGSADALRLKVWNRLAGDALVYDNNPGAPDDIDTADPLPVATGSIVVHRGK